jgi:hypothetical protein
MPRKWYNSKIKKTKMSSAPASSPASSDSGRTGKNTIRKWIGRSAKRLESGLEDGTIGALDALRMTGNEAIGVVFNAGRSVMRNVFSPLTILDSDEGFFRSVWNSIKAVPSDMLVRNLGSIGTGITSLAGTVTGLDINEHGKGKVREGVGVAGIVRRFVPAAFQTATFFTGADVEDPMESVHRSTLESDAIVSRRKRWFPLNRGGSKIFGGGSASAGH